MKFALILTAIAVIIAGGWPLVINFTFVPETAKIIPSTGIIYQGIIILIGALALLYAVKAKRPIRP